ncbi:MAG: potassium-transporting ATPase subunit KdpA, partial [Parachlamydiaceae bacterium]
LVKTIVYILLPLSFLLAIALVSEGTIQTFSSYVEATTLENHPQTIPLGPVASQAAIKQLGTNGGGFFNVNAAHPFENPTSITNFLQTLAILLIPAASVYTYGCLIGSRSQGILSLGIMFFLFALGLLVAYLSAHLYNPGIDSQQILEGKDTRLGTTSSLSWTAATTATSNGSTNAMLSSLSPLGGGIALFNIMIGEMIFGGIGTGLCHMLMFTFLTVFLCGLMVGRTPEFLGKKIERTEIQWVVLAILTPSALVLIGAGLFSVWPATLAGLGNVGPHGLTEILYAFASSAGNNGSNFGSLQSNTLPYNLGLGLVILIARIVIILATLGIAGSLARKTISPPSVGSLSTNSFMFAVLLTSIILTVGALSFFPALSLGPIAEEILMLDGRTF